MVAMGIEIINPNLLIVEGSEDQRFFEALANRLGLQSMQTLPLGGKTQLRSTLKALTASPGFASVASLGLVRDANGDPAAAFRSMIDALVAAKLPAPIRVLDAAVAVDPEDNEQPAIVTQGILSEMFAVE
jgi:hypothetical protein